MDKNVIGIVVFLVGVVAFLQSFKLGYPVSIVYLLVGVVLMIGGLLYARTGKK